jgi:HTH-type transcriptional regulator/antitoxin HigA
MEQRGLTRRDLEPYIGSRARVAEVLNRKRRLTLAMIRRLHSGLGIPAEALLS